MTSRNREAGTALVDDAARERTRTDTRTSLFVEASAGTGKTRALVDRILQLVLHDGIPLSRVAAMTFTEKAAGEMKVRLKEALDREAEEDAGDAARRERARAAQQDLETAEIGTLHAFCARLLRERPVEAGVDPGFAFPSVSVARQLVHETFTEWALEQAEDAASPFSRALMSGADLKRLRDLAERLAESRPLLATAELPRDVLGELRAELAEIDLLFGSAWATASAADRAHPQIAPIVDALAELRHLARLDLAAAAAYVPRAKVSVKRASKLLPTQAHEPLEEAVKLWEKLPDSLATLPLEPVLVDLLDSLETSFLSRVDEAKRRAGFLDFDDLLLLARRLLADHPAVRAHFTRRFATLVVDEFQDTDPLQAEIVLRLTAGGARGHSASGAPEQNSEPQHPDRWDDLVPRPGALFVVGDPKQSIFRFRRGDVETYRSVRDRFPESDRVTLETSFRASPGLLEYVNAVFAPVLTEDSDRPWEIGYTPLALRPGTKRGARPDVLYLLPPASLRGDRDERRREEASAVANLLASRFASSGWASIGLLVFRNDDVDLFREALTAAGIPVVLEGGRRFADREETAAACAALTAIEDPTDSVAVVATLKSFLFGASDLELVEGYESGVRFDDLDTVPAGSPLAPAAELLLRLHRERHTRPFAETLLSVLSARDAFLAIDAGALRHGIQARANLERLLLAARELDAEGLSYSQALARLLDRLTDEEGEPRAVEESDRAVRLTTIHKAKGLEYDTVVVAGLGLNSLDRSRDGALTHDRAGGRWGTSLEMAGRKVGTPGHRALVRAEKLRAEAEVKRLLYVAFTRARKTLAVSWYRGAPTATSDPFEKTLLGTLRSALPESALPPGLVERVEAPQGPAGLAAKRETLGLFPPDLTDELDALERRRLAVAATASRALRRAGEHEARVGTPPVEDAPAIERAAVAGGRALRIGIAVHEAMERLLHPEEPRGEADALADVSRELAPDEALEVRRLVKNVLRSPVVTRALAASRRHVELPLLYRDAGGCLVEGKIDLLFEEADGFTIVDWKTDRVSGVEERAALEALYAPQLAAYREGLVAVLGPEARVKDVMLVFARE